MPIWAGRIGADELEMGSARPQATFRLSVIRPPYALRGPYAMILRKEEEEEGEEERDCVLGVVDIVNGGWGGGGKNLIVSVTLENRRPMLGWK